MTKPFSVIQGGLGAAGPGAWRAELRHPLSLSDAETAAWRGLMGRTLEPSVYAEPDFVLTMAQHLADGRTLALLLVWQGEATLRGVLPLRLPSGLGLPGQACLWRLPLSGRAEAVIDRDHAPAVLRAALEHLAGSRLRVTDLRLPDLRPDGPLAIALGAVAGATGRRLTVAAQPAPRPDARPPLARAEGRTSLERVREPRQVRDAIEQFLVLDARQGRDSLIADPARATAFRVAVRRFARRRQACVDLVRRDGTVVAAAIHLASGPCDAVWRQAGLCLSETGAPPHEAGRVEAIVAVEARSPAARRGPGGSALKHRAGTLLRRLARTGRRA
ncbi:hypothetical protein OPKNFCMD_0843 [Methylobacterium crusticola]|uniref:BioF2-like acetyltransferase domain-containing protein n=1 Tax=Methylobacterium crusticola TaxID=1697972 RepID=A0ABQ4QU68_9HYPH|nr:GNAT family N-acetyltransferase [Methylobacterium crusticola]GJD48127.1 hypothetical protein OPKNFCMD_0843 [Methylobacterium crusticola]